MMFSDEFVGFESTGLEDRWGISRYSCCCLHGKDILNDTLQSFFCR